MATDDERTRKIWKRLSWVFLVLAVIVVAGPQILALFR
jgi:hypothetical protein